MSRPIRRRNFLMALPPRVPHCSAYRLRAIWRWQAIAADPDFHVYLAFGQSTWKDFPASKTRTRPALTRASRCWPQLTSATLGRKQVSGIRRYRRCAAVPRASVQPITLGAPWWRGCRVASNVGVVNVA